MHLLYIHQYFKFPDSSGGTRSYDLAKAFTNLGVQVTVITSDTSQKDKSGGNKWTIIEREGITVYSINCPYSNKMGFYRRIRSFLSFMYQSSKKCLSIKCDVVLATSTPLTVAVPALAKRIFKKTPYIFEVRDVWPEVPIKMGILNNKLLICFLRYFEKLTYKRAAAIVPLSVGMYKNITSRIHSIDHKMTIIPNISELDRFAKIDKTLNMPFAHNGKKIFLYCGTMGEVNGIKYMVDLAIKTKQVDSNIIYCIAGGGKQLNQILEYAKEKNVLNVNLYYLGIFSKEQLSYLYSISTVGSSFVINNPVLWDNSANKFFDTLAARRPIVINHEGWQADEIRDRNCGYILPANIDDLNVEEFVELMNNTSKLKTLGENAYQLAVEKYSLKVAVTKYKYIFDKIAK